MLTILRRIVQEVSAARTLDEALAIIVTEIKTAMNTDVCSVYLGDPETRRLTLMATDGLLRDAVGAVSLALDEGLVGTVAKREEPMNLDNATVHPKFRYFPETGEERYDAFLGVPIIHQRKVLGVLVVQHGERRRFRGGEVAFLVTLSAQLAGLIAHAQATGDLGMPGRKGGLKGTWLTGLAGAPGIGIGTAVVVYPPADLDAVPDRATQNPEAEIARFHDALEGAKAEIGRLAQQVAASLPPEEQALFDAFIQIIGSDSLVGGVEAYIRAGSWAEAALRDAIGDHVRIFEGLDDEYLRERAADLKDLGRRVLAQLQAREGRPVAYPKLTVLVGDEISASQLAEVPSQHLAGIVSARGSGSSHVAILARALGVPAVMGVQDLSAAKREGERVIVDGNQGRAVLSPSRNLVDEYRRLMEQAKQLSVGLKGLRHLQAETTDGTHVPLYVNTGLLADITPSLSSGAEGIGLYRTEVPFMIRERFPAEDEQQVLYREVLERFSPRPVVMRTLDIGGDKALPYFPIDEENPFLGWRGIRITLDHPEIFLVQVRAMIRASLGLDNLHILLPMVSSVKELGDSLALIQRAHSEVGEEEGAAVAMPRVGAMIEVPSAVYQIRTLARKVDFVSVGSNDLTQYLLAVDRNNARVAGLFDTLHPGVLRALLTVVEGAHAEGKPVSICGEMAGDPLAAVLLIGMGYDILSMGVPSLPWVKSAIRSVSKERARTLVDELLSMDNGYEVRDHAQRVLEDAGVLGAQGRFMPKI